MPLDSAKLRGQVCGNACPVECSVGAAPDSLFLMLEGGKALFLPAFY